MRSDAEVVQCAQVLEATALDFSRYGDTLFEVLFAGGRLAAGGNVVEEGKKLDTNVRPPMPQLPCSAMYSAPRSKLGTGLIWGFNPLVAISSLLLGKEGT